MAFVEFAPVYRPVHSWVARVFQAATRRVIARAEARSKRESLERLLSAPDYLLSDIGITRAQLLLTIETLRK
jgi:uncharacterized protein YjiS (DUF1127 family)